MTSASRPSRLKIAVSARGHKNNSLVNGLPIIYEFLNDTREIGVVNKSSESRLNNRNISAIGDGIML